MLGVAGRERGEGVETIKWAVCVHVRYWLWWEIDKSWLVYKFSLVIYPFTKAFGMISYKKSRGDIIQNHSPSHAVNC